jgi:hypothetical protein
MTTREEAVEEMGRWLRENHNAYDEGVKKLSDPIWVRNMLRALKHQLDEILMYNAVNHDPHVAVFAIGRVQARTEGLFSDLLLLDQWEEEKERYDEAVKNLPPEEDESPNPG